MKSNFSSQLYSTIDENEGLHIESEPNGLSLCFKDGLTNRRFESESRSLREEAVDVSSFELIETINAFVLIEFLRFLFIRSLFDLISSALLSEIFKERKFELLLIWIGFEF